MYAGYNSVSCIGQNATTTKQTLHIAPVHCGVVLWQPTAKTTKGTVEA